MVGIVVEKDDTAVFNLTRHSITNTVRSSIFFPVETINIIYKSKDLFFFNLKNIILYLIDKMRHISYNTLRSIAPIGLPNKRKAVVPSKCRGVRVSGGDLAALAVKHRPRRQTRYTLCLYEERGWC